MNKYNLNLTKPNIQLEEIKSVNKVMKSGWLIRGEQTRLFEAEFASFMGAKYAVATNGCTMALYLVLKKLNLKKTDEVIVPSLTWTATASAVIQAGAKPVFADVDTNSWCLDPEDVKAKITKNTKLIIPVHYAGRYAEGFDKFSTPVLFDSAHRIEKNDFKGVTSCYSFYAVKNMTTVRGGMILTNDKKEYDWYQKACHGGLTKDTRSRYQGADDEVDVSKFYYEVEFPSWNFDMTDIEAAIGRVQLTKLKKLNTKRNKLVDIYNEKLGLQNKGNHLYPILVANRDEFLVKMKKVGIQCGIHYLPLHTMKAYHSLEDTKLKITEFIGKHCVSLPLYPDLKISELKYIADQTLKHAILIKPLVNTAKRKPLRLNIKNSPVSEKIEQMPYTYKEIQISQKL